jgi:uncharacterized repeat protein (TIGR02543 family)
MVVLPGKFHVLSFLILALLPLFFAACPSPTDSDDALSGSLEITFDLDGGKWNDNTTAPAKRTLTYPKTAVGTADFPDNPTQFGYTFAGWRTGRNGSGVPFTATTTVKGDTVYAQWTQTSSGSYTVTFMANDGTTVPWAAKTASPGTAIATANFPANPTRENYAFKGWTTTSTGSEAFTATTPVNGNRTVYAQWTQVSENSYSVTFMMNDGTGAIHAVNAVMKSASIGTANFPAAPVRSGYRFDRWTTTASSGTTFDSSTWVYDNLTVYARWTANPYTITYILNNGTNPTNPPTSYTIESSNITLPTPTRTDGYAFDGWRDKEDLSGDPVIGIPTGSTGNKTFYAKWTANPYTITYHVNGGTAIDPGTYTIENLPFPLPTPSRSGSYTFGGWYDNEGLNGTAFTTIPTGSMEDKAFYAKWIVNAGIILDPEGAGGAFSQENFTIAKPYGSQSISVTGTGYSNPRWFVDGILKETTGTGMSITISAADYGAGRHNLSLIITKSGISWSKEITFTVN